MTLHANTIGPWSTLHDETVQTGMRNGLTSARLTHDFATERVLPQRPHDAQSKRERNPHTAVAATMPSALFPTKSCPPGAPVPHVLTPFGKTAMEPAPSETGTMSVPLMLWFAPCVRPCKTKTSGTRALQV